MEHFRVLDKAQFRIALIGQGAFSADLLARLAAAGYTVSGVFTIPDDPKTGRPDALAAAAAKLALPLFKLAKWRHSRDQPEVLEEAWRLYEPLGAHLNVLPFCNQIIPQRVIEAPQFKSINYHPSLLPKHRGASSINWTLIEGDAQAGLTVFWTDQGLDTGPVLLKRACYVLPDDTVESLYSRFLFPQGVEALLEAIELVRLGQAPRVPQPLEGATYDPMLRNRPDLTQIDFSKLQSAQQLHNFIRGLDKVPGAWCKAWPTSDHPGERLRLFGSSIYHQFHQHGLPEPLRRVRLEGLDREALVHPGGLLIILNQPPGAKPQPPVNVTRVHLVEAARTIPASAYGGPEAERPPLELTAEELKLQLQIKAIWGAILQGQPVCSSTDFFYAGAGSMDVTRLVEEVKELLLPLGDHFELQNEDVYMASQFEEFVHLCVRRLRGETSPSGAKQVQPPKYVRLEANRMQLELPTQLFINNQFVDSRRPGGPKLMRVENPSTEELICEVQEAGQEDVERAVASAKLAFDYHSEWRRMSARDRGRLLYKLAELMELHKEQLATLEALDSGAVYTLALKTHVGMSIEAFRYFAGWCDKIQGQTIPISHARPQSNLTFTKREPVGVCALITPWNYPLMMVCWKAAACLAAGNTLVLKPAQACPLTALKWAELVSQAGFPAGVVNVLTGRGSHCGQALIEHPDVAKVGFTGSTETGHQVMGACAMPGGSLKRCSLELGGKSPLIVFADCDIKRAIRFAMSSVFFNKGENCIAAGRLFVEESIHDQLVERLLAETRKIIVDEPLKRSTSQGPQNHRRHLEELLEFCRLGEREGARLLTGGRRLPRPGYFFEPAIFTEVADDMAIAKLESFGPIMIISRFPNGDIEGVVRRANASRYGLASGVITSDISKALRVADELDAGTCFINTYNKTDVAAPFGGFKQSGFGKDLGQEALNDYLRTKTVTVEY